MDDRVPHEILFCINTKTPLSTKYFTQNSSSYFITKFTLKIVKDSIVFRRQYKLVFDLEYLCTWYISTRNVITYSAKNSIIEVVFYFEFYLVFYSDNYTKFNLKSYVIMNLNRIITE